MFNTKANKSQYLSNKKLPDTPGIYFFLGKNKEILYVGKATSLRSRVRSYFLSDLGETRGPLITQMVAEARAIDFKATDSVLEALILEADLIKKFQPRYNTKEKDDKSFNCVVITKEDFPRVLIVRKRDIDSAVIHNSKFIIHSFFGPFPNGTLLKEALKIIRRIFPFRDAKCTPGQGKPCFNRQIGLCPGVCTGEISKQDYAKTIRNLILFFSGKKTLILKNLRREMRDEARMRNFERAGEIKRQIFALEHIQDVSLLRSDDADRRGLGADLRGQNEIVYRIEAYDIAHISGTDVVGAMVVVEGGVPVKSDYRKFKIKGGFGNNDVASLGEVIERRLGHSEWPLPSLFVADGAAAQKSVIETALKARGLSIPVVAVTKDRHHRPEKIFGDKELAQANEKAILLANSEAHRFALAFHRKRRSII
jgi:excinuclease ABC subunit C